MGTPLSPLAIQAALDSNGNHANSKPLVPFITSSSSSFPYLGPAPSLVQLQSEVDEAKAFLAAQKGYSLIAQTIDTIMSSDAILDLINESKSKFSNTRTNRVAKISEDIAALLTDTKPSWQYTTANKSFEAQAQILSKLSTFWYQNRNIDLCLGEVIQYYTVAGTGYLHLYWDQDPHTQDILGLAEDPRNVLPIRPANFRSLEDCQGVIVCRLVPVSYVQTRYNKIVMPDSDGSAVTWMAGGSGSVDDDVASPIHRSYRSQQGKSQPKMARIPCVTLYTRYYKDPTRNQSPITVEMGEGMHKYKVGPGDLLYPYRRMTVWAGDTILYDGPGFYWHGHFPLIKLTLNPKPWAWFGKAPLHDLLTLQKSTNQLLRVVDDHAAQVAEPGAIMDKNNVSKSQYDSFSTRRAGYKVLQNPLAGKGIQIVQPPPLDAAIQNQIEWNLNEMAELAGIKDLDRMMDLKQLPSNETVENIIHQMTPSLRMRSRILEAFFREVAYQMSYNFAQYYTLPMRVTILGSSGITAEDVLDFDPGSFIPDLADPHQGMDAETLLNGPAPRADRAKLFLRQFIYTIAPGSLLNSAQIEKSMLYVMLMRAGVMDPITVLEELGVPNIGVDAIPDNVRTIIERLLWCQKVGLTPSVNPVGRKASGQQAPNVQSNGPTAVTSRESS